MIAQHMHRLTQLTLCMCIFNVLIIHGEGNGTPLQYSCLKNPMDGGAWWATVPGVSKSRTRLSDFTFTFHFHALEKEMATHSGVLAWRIPGTGEPAGLLSTQLKQLAAAAAADGAGCHDLHFLNVEFYASFFTLLFHFH